MVNPVYVHIHPCKVQLQNQDNPLRMDLFEFFRNYLHRVLSQIQHMNPCKNLFVFVHSYPYRVRLVHQCTHLYMDLFEYVCIPLYSFRWVHRYTLQNMVLLQIQCSFRCKVQQVILHTLPYRVLVVILHSLRCKVLRPHQHNRQCKADPEYVHNYPYKVRQDFHRSYPHNHLFGFFRNYLYRFQEHHLYSFRYRVQPDPLCNYLNRVLRVGQYIDLRKVLPDFGCSLRCKVL